MSGPAMAMIGIVYLGLALLGTALWIYLEWLDRRRREEHVRWLVADDLERVRQRILAETKISKQRHPSRRRSER